MLKLNYTSKVSGEWLFRKPIEDSVLEAYNTSRFRNSNVLHNLAFLRNKKITFIGDSVTRYQFLYLIHYIHTGRWSDPFSQQMCCERHYPSWTSFYASMSIIFGCNHLCDCQGNLPGKPPKDRRLAYIREHQYYYDPDLNLMIHFHYWKHVADIATLHYLTPPTTKEFLSYCHNFTTHSTVLHDLSGAPAQRYENISVFLSNFIQSSPSSATLSTLPDILILNHGIFDIHENPHAPKLKQRSDLLDEFTTIAKQIVNTKKKDGGKGLLVWKITTANQYHDQFDSPEFLTDMKARGYEFFDSFVLTEKMIHHRGGNWDHFHFQGFVYRELNIALLEHLQSWLAVS